MEQISTKMKQREIEWRRSKVLELSSKGNSQTEICIILNIPKSTINRDINYLRTVAKKNIKEHIEERLPYEYEQCLQGMTYIIQQAWTLSQKSADNNIKEKLQSLSLAKDCYSIKMDLLTNSNLLKDAIQFVEQSREKIRIEMPKEEIEKNEKKVMTNKEKNEDDLSRSTENNSSKRRTYNTIF